MSWMTKLLGMLVVASLAACAAPSERDDAEKTTLSPDAARVIKEEGKVEASTEESKKDSRVVCESVKKTGSHMKETHCYSVAERDRQRERTQDEMQRAQRGGTRSGDQ